MTLYFIRDRVSGQICSNPVPAVNDGVALNGLRHFCQEQEKEMLNKAMYELVKSADYEDDGTVHSVGTPVVLANGNNVDQVFDEWCQEQLEDVE